MIERIWLIDMILQLIDRERENARRYIELNPQDADRRRAIQKYICGAYSEILYRIAE